MSKNTGKILLFAALAGAAAAGTILFLKKKDKIKKLSHKRNGKGFGFSVEDADYTVLPDAEEWEDDDFEEDNDFEEDKEAVEDYSEEAPTDSIEVSVEAPVEDTAEDIAEEISNPAAEPAKEILVEDAKTAEEIEASEKTGIFTPLSETVENLSNPSEEVIETVEEFFDDDDLTEDESAVETGSESL